MNNSITNAILWASIEDFVGLWETLWEVNTLLPAKNEIQNKDLTKETLTHLLNKGFVKCYQSTWNTDDLVEIPSIKAIESLDEEDYWQPPKLNDTCLKFGCTKEGEVIRKKIIPPRCLYPHKQHLCLPSSSFFCHPVTVI